MAELSRVDETVTRVQTRSRWVVAFQAMLGAWFGALTALIGLAANTPIRLTVITACSMLILSGLLAWSLRQRIIPRHFGRRYAVAMVATTILYVAALNGGLLLFGHHWGAGSHHPEYWLPAGVLVAVPLALGAARARRA